MPRRFAHRLYTFFNEAFQHPLKTLRGIPLYFSDLAALKKQKGNNDEFFFGTPYPIFSDRFVESGTIRGYYFHQDLLMARRIYKNQPKKHIDIGSRIDGFVAHVASFREIEIFDIRPLKSTSKNMIFRQADLMNLPAGMAGYCDSVSSLHAIEHFGLGRYGDPIDYFGHVKAIENIHKILKPGGKFYFSVPMGKQRIEFNAHRVFDVSYLVALFRGKFKIDQFSYVNDAGDLFEDAPLNEAGLKDNYGCSYGCGIFEMTKI